MGQYTKVTVARQSFFQIVANQESHSGDLRIWRGNLPESGGSTVVGFENHSGRTRLGSGVRPLGKVLKGYGNNGKDKTEGVRYRNAFCTYSHGPVLPKNPAFADTLLETALRRKYGACTLEPLQDQFENLAHDSVLKKI